MTQYGDMDLGHIVSCNGLLPSGHQAITWTNVYDCQRGLLAFTRGSFPTQEMLKFRILEISLKIANIRLQPHRSEASELIHQRTKCIDYQT